MKILPKCCLLFLLINWSSILLSQDNDKQPEVLYNRVSINSEKIVSDPDAAYPQLEILLNEARESKDRKSELILLRNKCLYFRSKSNLEKLLATAQELQAKSAKYGDYIFEANSYIYSSQAYSLNGLDNEGYSELEKALAVVEKADQNTSETILLKGSIYTEMANISYVRKDYRGQANYMHLVMKEHSRMPDLNVKRKLRFRDYSNLAATYYEFNLDSASYFARKSVIFSRKEEANSNLMFNNYLVIGTAFQKRKNLPAALDYFQRAEKIKKDKNFLNLQELYGKIIETYKMMGDSANIKKYENELNLLKLQVSEKKNRSLHKIIADTKKNSSNKLYLIWGISVLILVGGLVFVTVSYRRKKLLMINQEKDSQAFLQKELLYKQEQQTNRDLIEAIKNDDPAFMFLFNKNFPDFSDKLSAIFPDISKAEVEFCALIKLNLSTKEIARYKMVDIRSVQNRKYRLRKKLGISQDVDIYDWFKTF